MKEKIGEAVTRKTNEIHCMSSFTPVNQDWRRVQVTPCQPQAPNSEDFSRRTNEAEAYADDDKDSDADISSLAIDDAHMETSPIKKAVVAPWEDLIDIACLYGFKPHDRKNHGSLCRACKSRSSRCTKHIRPKRLSTTPAQILSSESQMHSEDRPRTAAITPSYSARPSMLHLPSIPVTMNTDLHNKVLSSHHLEAGTFAYNILFLDHNPAYDFVEHHEHPSPLRFQSTQPAKSLPNPPWSSHSDGNLADNPHKLFPSEATNRNHTRQPEPATAQTSSTIYVDTSPVSPPKPTYIKGPNPTVPIAHPRTPLLTLKFRPVSPGLSRALPRTVLPPLLKVDLPSGLSALPLRKYPRNSCEPSRDDDDEAIADEFAKQLRETQRRQQGQDEVEREGYEEHASQMRTAAAIPTVASQTPSTKLAVLRAAGRLAENHSRTYAHTQSA